MFKIMHIIGMKLLNTEEMGEVDEWLRRNHVDIHRLRRDFSDVWPLAVLLKNDYPRLINMVNYPKRHRISLKQENWKTLNFKVLSKLSLSLGRGFMEDLAKGTAGAIEVLIHELIQVEKRKLLDMERKASAREARDESVATETLEESDESQAGDQNEGNTMEVGGGSQAEAETGVKTVMVNKQVGSGIVQVPSKMIHYSRYERISRECQAKEAIIQLYQNRLAHLEATVQAKADRMDEILMIIDNLHQSRGSGQLPSDDPPNGS